MTQIITIDDRTWQVATLRASGALSARTKLDDGRVLEVRIGTKGGQRVAVASLTWSGPVVPLTSDEVAAQLTASAPELHSLVADGLRAHQQADTTAE